MCVSVCVCVCVCVCVRERKGKGKGKGSGVWPSMVTHTRNLSSDLTLQVHTHSSEHTPGAVGQPYCGTRGAVGGSVPCSRVSQPLSRGIEVERARVIHSPHRQSLPDLGIEPATFGLQVQLSNH